MEILTMCSLYDCDEWRSTDSMTLEFETLEWSPVNKIDNLNRDFFVLCHD